MMKAAVVSLTANPFLRLSGISRVRLSVTARLEASVFNSSRIEEFWSG
jgi:hypothetical protein